IAVDSYTGLDHVARFPAAQGPRRGADELGHREWREANRPDDDADRCRDGHWGDVAAARNRDRGKANCTGTRGEHVRVRRTAHGGDFARFGRWNYRSDTSEPRGSQLRADAEERRRTHRDRKSVV